MKQQRKKESPVGLIIFLIIAFLSMDFGIAGASLFVLIGLAVGTFFIVKAVNKHKQDNPNYPTDSKGNYVNKNYGESSLSKYKDTINRIPHSLDGIFKGEDTMQELGSEISDLWNTAKKEFNNSDVKPKARAVFDKMKDELSVSERDDEDEAMILSGGTYDDMMSEEQGLKDLLRAGIIEKAEYNDRMRELHSRS